MTSSSLFSVLNLNGFAHGFHFDRNLCDRLISILRPDLKEGKKGKGTISNGREGRKLLDAPVLLGNAAAHMQGVEEESGSSIWNKPKADELVSLYICPSVWQVHIGFLMQKVDTKKLEKAEQKLQQKQQSKKDKAVGNSGIANATASQVLSKKDAKMEAKGTNNCKDIRIENFDIAFGEKYRFTVNLSCNVLTMTFNRTLLQGCDLTLTYGRRYGFVGRNGLGKTTLLRMISS